MGNFVNRYHLLKLNEYQTNNLKRSIVPSKIEGDIQIISIKRIPGSDGFSAKFLQIFKEDLMQVLLKFSHKIEAGEALSNSFYQDTVT